MSYSADVQIQLLAVCLEVVAIGSDKSPYPIESFITPHTGQNLAFGYTNWAHVIDGWFSEIEYFQYGRQDDMSFREVGHFTQLTWAESAKIGCGWAKCSNLKGRILYACNYATQ